MGSSLRHMRPAEAIGSAQGGGAFRDRIPPPPSFFPWCAGLQCCCCCCCAAALRSAVCGLPACCLFLTHRHPPPLVGPRSPFHPRPELASFLRVPGGPRTPNVAVSKRQLRCVVERGSPGGDVDKGTRSSTRTRTRWRAGDGGRRCQPQQGEGTAGRTGKLRGSRDEVEGKGGGRRHRHVFGDDTGDIRALPA